MSRRAFIITALALLAVGSLVLSPRTAPGATYTVTDSLHLTGDGGWDYLIADGGAHRLYVSRGTEVQVIDLDHNSELGTIPNTSGVHGIALAPPTGEGYTSNGRDSSVTVFDLKTLKTITRIPVGARGPDAILFDPFTSRVFTFNGGGHNATAIDIHKHQVIGLIPLDAKPEFAASDSSGKIFVNLEDKSEIARIDAQTLKVLDVWPLKPGEEPTGLSIDRAHHRLFAGCGNQHLIVLDSETGKVVADLPIGKGVDATAFDPTTNLAFSSNGADGTLTVIREESPSKFSVLENVPTRRGARTMALDPVTHKIYLVTASFGPPPAATPDRPHPRPAIMPGTVVLLIASR